MEFFYRAMRKRHDVLTDAGQPVGGSWNYDQDNRGSFGKKGSGVIPTPIGFQPDQLTKQVIRLVEKQFPHHAGSLVRFRWPVTPEQAEQALDCFLQQGLPEFGKYKDAMWTGEPFLYHSLVSAALNLKLLDPRTVIERTENEYREGRAPLAVVEGFIRQILGWREYVRGVYWLHMPDYLERNTLSAQRDLPDFYWTGDTEMNCLRQAIGQTLEHGYAHHIQRLMVTGLYALLTGIDPMQVHEWYFAVYVDAIEWVELPNTLGMSQYADGGVMASKPYVATGKYIQRMSNYCEGCCYNPVKRTGVDACPFTTRYWDFLLGHRSSLATNHRMAMILRNLSRLSSEEARAIREQTRRQLDE
jgi:deoxyribodipyrimidine photolyase-related protein